MINIYTDGACKGNPGLGGWGVVIRDEVLGKERQKWGHFDHTTNNQMELHAVFAGLTELLKRKDGTEVTVYSDSEIIIKGMNEWIENWKSRGWKNANKKPVANRKYWECLDKLNGIFKITWIHVKAHSGHEYNELADSLANKGASGSSGVKTIKFDVPLDKEAA